tara:strand:+ start:567 stop:785 length:219 start_codon:yes stop_codon:yes gene_type:complete
MYKLIFVILLIFFTCTGCALMIAKETVDVLDEVLESDPNPEKKKKILKKQKTLKDKSREFYCSKVKDKEKCG